MYACTLEANKFRRKETFLLPFMLVTITQTSTSTTLDVNGLNRQQAPASFSTKSDSLKIFNNILLNLMVTRKTENGRLQRDIKQPNQKFSSLST